MLFASGILAELCPRSPQPIRSHTLAASGPNPAYPRCPGPPQATGKKAAFPIRAAGITGSRKRWFLTSGTALPQGGFSMHEPEPQSAFQIDQELSLSCRAKVIARVFDRKSSLLCD